MKQIICSILLSCIFAFSYSQQWEYREITIEISMDPLSQCFVRIDSGQYYKEMPEQLKDLKSGKAKIFLSKVEVLNYMGSHGWELVQCIPGNSRYIFKRKITK